jgi:hypothetical protein
VRHLRNSSPRWLWAMSTEQSYTVNLPLFNFEYMLSSTLIEKDLWKCSWRWRWIILARLIICLCIFLLKILLVIISEILRKGQGTKWLAFLHIYLCKSSGIFMNMPWLQPQRCFYYQLNNAKIIMWTQNFITRCKIIVLSCIYYECPAS